MDSRRKTIEVEEVEEVKEAEERQPVKRGMKGASVQRSRATFAELNTL
jgi:hypothetical protein